jgi:hypothetical protein
MQISCGETFEKSGSGWQKRFRFGTMTFADKYSMAMKTMLALLGVSYFHFQKK